jgi:Protein of unknown function (DUF3455)
MNGYLKFASLSGAATGLFLFMSLGIVEAQPSAAVAPTSVASLTPEGETARFTYAAIGVQIYECKVVDGKPAWAFVAPEADLFDGSGKRVGKHYAGPSWESDDGSKIVGTLKARADAPRAGAIPHLLVTTKAEAKPGVFASITSLQRINTMGGVAPSAPCVAADAGKQVRVYYSADYKYFSK